MNIDANRLIGIILGFLIGTTIHEFMHAYTAVRLGDNTPLRAGRVTLNPIAHFDAFGAILFVLLALGIAPFAYGKPVQVNPMALRGGRRGMMLVAGAGPLSNLVLGAVLAIPFRFNTYANLPTVVVEVLGWMVYVNFLLFVFNLIPLPPLDGFTVLTGVVSHQWSLLLEPIRRYGPAIFLALIFLPGYFHLNVIGRITEPFFSLLDAIFTGGRLSL
ncbi:MAG: site-2 protease family protein [Chloroflexota bacterium]|nr:site-2 protease family protein [Chloroflexota bacterium]